MTKMSPLLKRARDTLKIEIAGLDGLIARLGPEFEEAVNLLFACQGKVILAGMGKSGLIAQKIAATLTSTGTPSLFLHAGESSHGDLGIITRQDVVIAFSYSGETSEVVQMIGHIHAIGVPLIAMTGQPDSTLAQAATVHLSVAVEKEACPLGLTPTASSTATLALGDALAMCLLEQRQFREDDFATFHPGGSLGRKLTIRIKDVMVAGDTLPVVPENMLMREAMNILSRKNLGIVVAVDQNEKISGVFTTGDLMRLLEDEQSFLDKPLLKFAHTDPKTIAPEELAAKALHVMETHSITCLVVADPENRPIGIVQIYYILRAGVY
ncbi:MAG TPA: KpsF/GutQ family sugar-phosphate isomerase [Candidatus Lambdaproteobacteria bacterium]|nr:KpsF/GutQ family sugar-phosphate isomerase [SAR324 cluster bacterium]HBL56203.1 D-arabinose 5-phosphate isomerase [Deltaproteobacteria bacterium]HHZ78368.1 KpsF/GutQ family sugar-phosphate isomerase [Candidatus Lambdaproteobacteria bacterium]HIA57295.1 KpsF/GutQ family sugar-phosphate isomerase [Candidatus Lambdaproteobacteria bacterium]HIB45989.1 KpsF/GutQ family sugar-phosphate isomerase [Candidatus Lambdaproteobacteria bacterium]